MGNIKGSIRGKYKKKIRPKKYVCSLSFGKDSLATLLLALEHNEPLDAVVFVEVMYDNNNGISGENPIHIDWIVNYAIPRLSEMGVKVYHLRSDLDYLSLFHKIIVSGDRSGKLRAYPLARACVVQRECKLNPIRKFYKENFFSEGFDVVEYVGIAIDEPERLFSLQKSDSVKISKTSLLWKYGYTETMALLKCYEHGLLSPIYTQGGDRNGCWFCPNQSVDDFYRLRRDYPNLWGGGDKIFK